MRVSHERVLFPLKKIIQAQLSFILLFHAYKPSRRERYNIIETIVFGTQNKQENLK